MIVNIWKLVFPSVASRLLLSTFWWFRVQRFCSCWCRQWRHVFVVYHSNATFTYQSVNFSHSFQALFAKYVIKFAHSHNNNVVIHRRFQWRTMKTFVMASIGVRVCTHAYTKSMATTIEHERNEKKKQHKQAIMETQWKIPSVSLSDSDKLFWTGSAS